MKTIVQKFKDVILSRYILMTIILPLVIYNIGEMIYGVGLALILSVVWLVYLNRKFPIGNIYTISGVMILSGAFHSLWNAYPSLFFINREDVFLSITGSVSVVLVFFYGMLTGKQTIRNFAEQANPKMKEIPLYGTEKYRRAWMNIDISWIVVLILKVMLLLYFQKYHYLSVGYLMFFLGWPLTIFLIYLSVIGMVRQLRQ
ncbi:hypothetical protein [Rosenbergiella collisarenosi]|uniref:hypothetical protein n=1 Tax=Rosenbergiella collisarenosi TaxID=1544695 RepID=UPI001F4F4647|nr:hypothetical protein [Rosenbergiella collisarenosi]